MRRPVSGHKPGMLRRSQRVEIAQAGSAVQCTPSGVGTVCRAMRPSWTKYVSVLFLYADTRSCSLAGLSPGRCCAGERRKQLRPEMTGIYSEANGDRGVTPGQVDGMGDRARCAEGGPGPGKGGSGWDSGKGQPGGYLDKRPYVLSAALHTRLPYVPHHPPAIVATWMELRIALWRGTRRFYLVGVGPGGCSTFPATSLLCPRRLEIELQTMVPIRI
jgi:hypothetical protein